MISVSASRRLEKRFKHSGIKIILQTGSTGSATHHAPLRQFVLVLRSGSQLVTKKTQVRRRTTLRKLQSSWIRGTRFARDVPKSEGGGTVSFESCEAQCDKLGKSLFHTFDHYFRTSGTQSERYSVYHPVSCGQNVKEFISLALRASGAWMA